MTSGRRSKEHRRQARQQARKVGHLAHARKLPEGGLRRFDGTTVDADAEVGTTIGWCATEADLTDARKQTHDALIKLMGGLRTGPVAWQWHTGEPAMAAIGEFMGSPEAQGSPVYANYYRQIRGKLREYGGYVVIAFAPGDKPTTRQWSCKVCGPHPDSTATWCAKGCGRDYQAMTLAEVCAAPDCGAAAVYLGQCHRHADEEFPDDRGVDVL